MLEARQSSDGEIIISRDGIDLLKVEEFLDKSHHGHHLFLSPLSKAVIMASEPKYELPWSHELLA